VQKSLLADTFQSRSPTKSGCSSPSGNQYTSTDPETRGGQPGFALSMWFLAASA